MADSISFDRIAACYDETRGGEARGHRIAAALEPLLAGQGRTLEIGIGTGVIARAFLARGRRVLGVDLSPLMAARAVDRLGPRVALGDATCLPVATGSCENAYSVWLLHLVGDVPAVLAEAARVLLPGGRYLVLPSSQGVDTELDRLLETMTEKLVPDRPGSRSATLALLAPPARLRVVDIVALPPFEYTETAADIIAAIEARTWSSLWDVPDATWAEVVLPVLDTLRALPGQDRPRPRRALGEVLVLERQDDAQIWES